MLITYSAPDGPRNLEVAAHPGTLLKDIEAAVRAEYRAQVGHDAPPRLLVTFYLP